MKKVLCLFLCLLCLLPLASCHGSAKKPAFVLPENFDESRPYTITFWAKNDTNLTQVAIYEQTIAEFEKLYPNITVQLRLYTDYGRIYNDVITNIATDTTPNVCITYPDHIAAYLTGADTVVPLDALMQHRRYGLGGNAVRFDAPAENEIVPQFLSECYVNGECFALPFMRSTEACYINKTFVEKLGYTVPDVLTWDFLWEVSEAATAKDASGNFLVNGQKVMIPCIYKSTDNMMISMLKQAGAGYSTSKGEIEIFNDTTKELLFAVASHAATGAFSTFKISSYPANFLNAGQCIFAIDSTGGATWMGSDAPLVDISEEALVNFETVVRPIPQMDVAHPKMISQGPAVCIFNKQDPQEVVASWLFVQYLLTDAVQIAYSQTEGYVPVTLKAQNSAEYQDYLAREGEDNELYYPIKLQAAKLLLSNTENTFVTPVFNGSASLRDAAGQMVENVTKSTRRKETVDEAYMEKLYRDMTALYRLDQIANDGDSKINLGEMPKASVALLAVLSVAWVCLGVYFLAGIAKKTQKIELSIDLPAF